MARGIVDGFETEDRDDARGTRFLDAPTEGADLLADHLQRTACVHHRRLQEFHAQEGEVTALPPQQRRRSDGGDRPGTGRSARGRTVAVPQPVLVHSGAQGIARDAEGGRGATDIAAAGAERGFDARRAGCTPGTGSGDFPASAALRVRKSSMAAVISSPSESRATRSMALANSRTLPGQRWAMRASRASRCQRARVASRSRRRPGPGNGRRG